ncbi:MAG: DNA-directed RNA polymerase subunit L [Euryarchaeota archaeon]|nr:DNA-directed RNA polymerase subunit L [Euryarchaeota archaeon]
MKFTLLEKEKDSIRVQITDLDETLFRPLIAQLLLDDVVTEAKYSLGHPDLDKPWIYIEVKSGKPQAALKRSLKALSNQFKEARELFEKELK